MRGMVSDRTKRAKQLRIRKLKGGDPQVVIDGPHQVPAAPAEQPKSNVEC